MQIRIDKSTKYVHLGAYVKTTELTRYFKEHVEEIMPTGYHLYQREYAVYGAKYKRTEVLGRIDYVFKKGVDTVLAEAELGSERTEFFSAFKVLAYKNAFVIDTKRDPGSTQCLIILNAVIYKPAQVFICAMAGIDYLYITPNGSIFKSSIHRGRQWE